MASKDKDQETTPPAEPAAPPKNRFRESPEFPDFSALVDELVDAKFKALLEEKKKAPEPEVNFLDKIFGGKK